MSEEAVTAAAADPKTTPTKRHGGLTKASQQARARAPRDPLAAVEADVSLDQAPDYKMEGRVEVPKPPHFRFGTDQPAPRRPEHFFQWWGGLTASQKQKCIVYVYRNYPVIGIKVADKKSPTGFRISSQIDKRSGTDVLKSLDDILHHYGSGNYTIRLNQADPNKAVCLCIIQGLRDEDHPPVVNLDTLLVDDPANRPYIEGLRLRGVRVPGVEPLNEEDQMGTAAVSQLVGTVERMVERNADLAAQASRPRPEAHKPGAEESVVSAALATGMKIIANASDTQSKMLENAMSKVTQLTNPAQTQAGPDPLAMLDRVGNLLRTFAPAPAAVALDRDGRPVPSSLDVMVAASLQRTAELEKRLHETQTQQMAFLQSMVLKAQESQASAPAAAPSSAKHTAAADGGQPATPSEMLRELVKLKEGLSNLTGDADSGGASEPAVRSNPNAPWWTVLLQRLPEVMQAGAAIASMVAVASYNNAIAKTGTGQPTPVTLPAPQPQPQPDMGDREELLPPPPSDGAETSLPQPGDATLNAYHHFLAQLEKPLLLAMENNESGDQFAEKLVGWQGQVAYDLLHGLGRDSIIQIMATYRPIWSVVSTIPQKFSQFLDEFLSYGDQEQSPDLLPVSPPPSGQPVVVSPGIKAHNPRTGKPHKNPSGPAPE